MKATEAVREIMKEQEVGVSQLANRLNRKQPATSNLLAQENIGIAKLNELLRVLDYKVIIVPRDTRLPKDSYEVE